MVGGVFSQHSGTTRHPATQNAKNNSRESKNHKDKKNRLSFVEVEQITHPSNHRGKELTDLRKQGSNSGSSSLKPSSFHKNFFYGHLSRPQQENQHRENSSEDNKIANLRDREDAETILQRQNFHQLMRPQIAFLIHVTVVIKTRTTSKAETQACGLRT